MGEVFKLFGTIGLKTDEAEKGLDNITGKAKKTSSGLLGFFRGAAEGAVKLAGAFGLVALARKGWDLLTGSIDQALSRIDTFEQFNRVMTVMTGSTEKANAVMEITNGIVKGTAYGLDIAARSVQNFVTSNMEVDQATDTVAAWGDAVAFYGDGSNETFSSVTDALAKMSAKGKVSMEEMNRLTERGIPALQIYADATGQSVEEVAAQMQKGELSSDEFITVMNEALKNGTENFAGIEGAAKEAGASWGATFDNMRAAVSRGVANIITKTDEMLEQNGFPTMREMVSNFGSKVEEVLNKIAEKIPSIIEKFVQFKDSISDAKDKILEFVETWSPLIAGIAAAVTAYGAYAIALGIKSAAETIAIGIMYGLTAATTALGTVMAFITSPIGLVVIAIGALVAIGVLLYKNWDTVKKYASITWNGIKVIISGVVNIIKTVVVMVFNVIKSVIIDVFNVIKSVTSSVWNGIKAIISGVVNVLRSIISSVFNAIKSLIVSIWNSIKNSTSSVWNGIKSVVSSVVNAVRSVITSVFSSIKSVVSRVWNSIKSVTSSVWNSIRSSVSSVVNSIRSTVSSVFNGIRSTVSSVWSSIKSSITNAIDGAKNAVSSAISKIKGFMNFKWSLPKLKLPKISIKGKFSLSPPKVPSFGIKWFAKGGIMEKAMAFGMNGNDVLAGGEAGPEAILPLNRENLGGIGRGIAESMGWSNERITDKLDSIIDLLINFFTGYDPEMQVVMDTGALVGAIKYEINRQLGNDVDLKGRGR